MAEWPIAGKRLAILLWATNPNDPAQCATPFFHALAAAAMEVRVEVYFTARSVRLLEPGVAAALRTEPRGEHTVYEFMQQAATLGVAFFACPQALVAQQMDANRLIQECRGAAGAATFVSRALDPSWVTLTY